MLTEEITLRLVKEIKRFLLEDALALSRSSDEKLMVRIKETISSFITRSPRRNGKRLPEECSVPCEDLGFWMSFWMMTALQRS